MLDWILDAIISGIGVLTGKARKRRASPIPVTGAGEGLLMRYAAQVPSCDPRRSLRRFFSTPMRAPNPLRMASMIQPMTTPPRSFRTSTAPTSA